MLSPSRGSGSILILLFLEFDFSTKSLINQTNSRHGMEEIHDNKEKVKEKKSKFESFILSGTITPSKSRNGRPQYQVSITAYYTKLKRLWDELCSGAVKEIMELEEQEKIIQFLMEVVDTLIHDRNSVHAMNVSRDRDNKTNMSHDHYIVYNKQTWNDFFFFNIALISRNKMDS